MTDSWARTLYERYVQLYGDPIEQPITKNSPGPAPNDEENDATPRHHSSPS